LFGKDDVRRNRVGEQLADKIRTNPRLRGHGVAGQLLSILDPDG
jgi:hypothetical protein